MILHRAGLLKDGLRYMYCGVSANFQFIFRGFKRKSSFIHFANNLRIGFSKKNGENHQEKCFQTK